MRRGVIYVRVSYSDQVDGTSLGSQERECRKYCAENNIRVVEVFIEPGRSAKTCDRPELHRLLDFCGKQSNQVDVLVVHKLDRLSRNSDDHGFLKVTLAGYGVAIDSATEDVENSPEGRLMGTILRGFAQFENERRGQRSKGEMVTLVEQGYWCHKGPIGYVNSRNSEKRPVLVEDPERGPLVRRAFGLVGDHGHSQKAALADVTARGLVGHTGKPIRFQAFSRMLSNGLYAGRICCKQSGGRTIAAQFAPLVDPDLFDRVQAIIAAGDRRNSPQVRDSEVFPLRNWIKCTVCGRPLTGSRSTGKTGRKFSYYHCYGDGCGAIRVTAKKLEDQYRALLRGICESTSPVIDLLREIVFDRWGQRQAEIQEVQGRIAGRIRDLEQRKSRLLDAYLDGKVDQDAFQDKKAEIEAQICLSKCEQHDEHLEALDIEAVLRAAEHVLCNAESLWRRLPLAEKRRLDRLLFPEGIECTMEGKLQPLGVNPAVELCEMLGKQCKSESSNSLRMAPPRRIELLFPG